ncbi:MAG TPA: zf-HC2 domain-containing protein [Jatrophihabitans sp.]|nr:zf-HC2 domain-containing protein [Jatrophihabitans sp.]
MSSPDPFRFDDGVYVLGVQSEEDRAAFEEHLGFCDECRARVAEARVAAGLLTGVDIGNLEDVAPMPDTLLPGLLRRAERERRRRRWLVGSLSAVAAACLVALVVLVWPTSSPGGPPVQAFTAVRSSPVSATAQLVARGWGTEIDLRCQYADNVEHYVPYNLVVVDRQGQTHEAGSWTLAPGRTMQFTGGTAVPRNDIAQVRITLPNGTPLLQLTA